MKTAQKRKASLVFVYLVAGAPMGEADHCPLGEGRKSAPSPTCLSLPRGETPGVEAVPPASVVLQQTLRLLQDVPDRVEGVELSQLELQASHLSRERKGNSPHKKEKEI